jgi:ER-bound oxygenase mpaB/B'/Rubber oxygenase, catalytic domain
MRRDHWRVRNDRLDPETDFAEIVRNLATHEFPWDTIQALSFALFRTYAVPGIGRLLDQTGAFAADVQKRYDDTALLLEPPGLLGFDHPSTRTAIRRINQMHRSYDIPNHQMRYVLSTFVVVPRRWIDTYGKRPFTDHEVTAVVHYYRTLGRHLGITDIPETFEEFSELMDTYEAEHFAFDGGARRVADRTLELVTTFYPRPLRRAVEVFSRALMDERLLRAFRYDVPHPVVVRICRAALRARGRLLRHFPARRRPKLVEDFSWVRSYPDGYDLARLGTFPASCPVPHPGVESAPGGAAPNEGERTA